MLKHLLISLFALVGSTLKAQVNLVPNGSFEEYYQIPTGIGEINSCKGWFNPTWNTGSPEYYSGLATYECIQVPSNCFGYENAFDGIFYSGIYIYQKDNTLESASEYIECRLTEPLQHTKYCVSLYYSLADSASCYVVPSLGIYFSADSIHSSTQKLSQYSPQIVNTVPITAANKTGWTKLSASYSATGGETFMTIGNFTPEGLDDTTYVGGCGQNFIFPRSSYIYIDSVSVTACNSVVLTETLASAIAIYPNPATNTVSISLPQNYLNPQLYIYNLTGQLVVTKPIQANQPVHITELNAGMYIFAIQSNNTLIGRQRLVVY